MSDINNLGSFSSIDAVWAKYPEGGKEGDFLTIGGVKHRWNKYDQIWENANTVTSSTARKLETVEGATNYANCGGASWAVSSNCKNTELAYDFLKSTFGASVELYDDLLPNAGAISSYLPAAESDVYNQPSEFYGGQTVYKDIVEFAGKVPAFDCGAYYSDVRSALTDAVTNVVQNNADIDSEMQNAQDTVEFNIAG